MNPLGSCYIALILLAFPLNGIGQTVSKVIKQYSNYVHASYEQAVSTAVELELAVKAFTASPSVFSHERAKAAWKLARESYGPTEAFRFYNGPIDREGGPEGQLNAWPLDEAYIDYVVGDPTTGIINNLTDYPNITKELLVSLNELNGERNIATGYHAIEFLLWGQDFFNASAGMRSYTDYTQALNADRRSQYLNILAELLVENLVALENEWRADGDNFRQDFESLPSQVALKSILTGAVYLAGDELAGERMYVAYDSRGQEDEQSCFSDMTHKDLQWNFQGVEHIILNLGLLELPEVREHPTTLRLKERILSVRASLASIPAPFDRALVNEDGRSLILQSVGELEELAREMVEFSALLNARVEF